MTTQVTVNAHAGWDVSVEVIDVNADGTETVVRTQVVSKHTEEHFYIHSHRRLGVVKEIPNAASTG
jgi:hypothetical protein